MKLLLLKIINVALIFLTAALADARPLVIAIVDSGINVEKFTGKLCKDGNKDFTKTGFVDNIFHGHIVAEIIASGLKEQDYCIVMLKFFDVPGKDYDSAYVEAMLYLHYLEPDIVNISASGEKKILEEELYLKKLLDKKIPVVVAAGNQNVDLGVSKRYPASVDSRITVVGALSANGTKLKTSNYGVIVDEWEFGHSPYDKQTGTSFAAPRAVVKIAKKLLKSKK